MSLFVQTGPQFDVFDGGAAVSRIESFHLQEDRAPDGAAATPEGRGSGVAVLVHKMMKEISVLLAGTR